VAREKAMKFEIHLDVMQVFVIIAFACLRSKWEKVPEGRMRDTLVPYAEALMRSVSLEASPSHQATLRGLGCAKEPQGEGSPTILRYVFYYHGNTPATGIRWKHNLQI
jgi:hypothetical protein